MKEKSIAILDCFDMSEKTALEEMKLPFLTEKHIFCGSEINGFKIMK